MNTELAKILDHLSLTKSPTESRPLAERLIAMDVVEELHDIGEDRHDSRQQVAIRALGAIGTQHAVNALVHLICDGDSSDYAVCELMALGTAGEDALLWALSGTNNPIPVQTAAWALADMGSERAIGPLLAALDRRGGWGSRVILGVTRTLVEALGKYVARGKERGPIFHALVPIVTNPYGTSEEARDILQRVLSWPPRDVGDIDDDDLAALAGLSKGTEPYSWYEEAPLPARESHLDVSAVRDRVREILEWRRTQWQYGLR